MKLISKKNFMISLVLFFCIPQILIGMELKKIGLASLSDFFLDYYAMFNPDKLSQSLDDIDEIRKTENDPNAYQELFDQINKRLGLEPAVTEDPRIKKLEKKLDVVDITDKNLQELGHLKKNIEEYKKLSRDLTRYEALFLNIEEKQKNLVLQEVIEQKALKLLREKQKLPITLVPTDALIMKGLNLCPLAQCVVDLGLKNRLKRELLQIKMAKQAGALCGGISLINAIWVERYTKSGNKNTLTYLHKKINLAKVLSQLRCSNWVNINQVKNYIKNAKEKGYDVKNISAISSVLVLDETKAKFLFKEEVLAGKNLKDKVHKGLTEEYFFQGIIVGNEESANGGHGHYFAFVIIKLKDQVQYIVIDSLDANHLTNGYKRRRINYLISKLETNEAENLILFTKYGAMVESLREEIDQFKKDRKFFLERTMSQQDFLKKYPHNKLINLQEKIDQHQILTEERDFQDELSAITKDFIPIQKAQAEEIKKYKMNSFEDIKRGSDSATKKRRLQTLIIGVGADEEILGSAISRELMELFTAEWCKLLNE